jgi:hypothetical protein
LKREQFRHFIYRGLYHPFKKFGKIILLIPFSNLLRVIKQREKSPKQFINAGAIIMKNLSFNTVAKYVLLAVLTAMTVTFSFGQETENQATTNSNAVKVGIVMPKASFTAEGVDNNQMALGIREVVAGYFQGTEVEIVPLEARIPQALASEAKEKGVSYILNIAVSQKKGGGGFGMFKAIAPVLSNVVPMAGVSGNVAGQVAGSIAQTAITSAAQMSSNTKAKDTITLEYSLVATDGGAVKNSNSMKAKAKSDGEDVLSPMMEKMAEAVLAAAK